MHKVEVGQLLSKNSLAMDEFLDWMRGQTIGMYDDGSPNYYRYDVERWISFNCGESATLVFD